MTEIDIFRHPECVSPNKESKTYMNLFIDSAPEASLYAYINQTPPKAACPLQLTERIATMVIPTVEKFESVHEFLPSAIARERFLECCQGCRPFQNTLLLAEF